MDSIDRNIMQAASDAVAEAMAHDLTRIHTVTITLNGQHGGADVTIEGDEGTEAVEVRW